MLENSGENQTGGDQQSRPELLVIDFAAMTAYLRASVSGSHANGPPAFDQRELGDAWLSHE